MLARKSVKQRFTPDEHIRQLMESFRRMTNDCIRIGLTERKTSLKALSLVCYPKLKRYDMLGAYKLGAISKTSGILRHYRKLSKKHPVREPYYTRPCLTTCYRIKISNGQLHAPNVEIPLNHYTQRSLSQPGIEVRSFTLTPESISISVRKEVQPTKPVGMVGLDMNLDIVTLADTVNAVDRYELRKAAAIKSQCRATKRRFTRNDVRVRRLIYAKYGRLEKNRTSALLHQVSANIVVDAKLKRQAIATEDLRGIRRLYRRGNGQGRDYRARMNNWSFRELQRQIQYKADWNGIPVIYVRAFGTSARCSMCGHNRMLPEENRQLHCPSCGLTVDRDVNAARNIVKRALRFGAVGSVGEAMVQEPNAPTEVGKALLKVDADQSNSPAECQPTKT